MHWLATCCFQPCSTHSAMHIMDRGGNRVVRHGQRLEPTPYPPSCYPLQFTAQLEAAAALDFPRPPGQAEKEALAQELVK